MSAGRKLFEDLGPALAPARNVRRLAPEELEDLSTFELETVAQSLRALGYSCYAGARHIDRIADTREEPDS